MNSYGSSGFHLRIRLRTDRHPPISSKGITKTPTKLASKVRLHKAESKFKKEVKNGL